MGAIHHVARRLIGRKTCVHATLLWREGTWLLLLGVVSVRLLMHHHPWVSLVLHDHVVTLREWLLCGIRERPLAHLIKEDSIVLGVRLLLLCWT